MSSTIFELNVLKFKLKFIQKSIQYYLLKLCTLSNNKFSENKTLGGKKLLKMFMLL